MLDPVIEKKARTWLGPEFDEKVREEIQALFDNCSWEELTDRFYRDLEFGTGGMRGVLGAGTNRMNEYVIRMTTQGLANYILAQEFDEPAGVIAYDSRHKSTEFALETALVLAANGIKAHLFKALRPTPTLSFAVRSLEASAGVVVTASHNPSEYNGYKVYWSDGGQVVPPHDTGIIDEVRKVSSLSEVKWMPREEAEKKGLLNWLGSEVDEAFLDAVAAQVVEPEIVRKASSRLGLVFTPLHGTGATLVPKALERMGLEQVEVLESQREPDPDFPTVKSPNPEEKAALELAIRRAGETGASLVLATDPDCDRVGLAYRSGKEFLLLNGNQIGSILCHYILERLSSREGALPQRPVIIKTIVTTELQRAIADSFGAAVIDVLTGFKYIGEQIRLLEEAGGAEGEFVFGGEESYGYLAGTHARDKDAVVSSQLIAEVAAWCAWHDKTMGDYLDDIFRRYGVYLESLRSLTRKGKKGSEEISALMERFRECTPESISGSRVVGCWDLATGEKVDLETETVEKTSLPSANVLVFYLDDKSKVTMRPSGTEPKIKFYFGVVGSCDEEKPLEEIKKESFARLAKLEEDFMEMVERALA